MTLHELATRAEQAEGANYALDVEIEDAIWRMKWGKRRPKDIKVQPYTASLDAAMMLVPKGCGFAIMGNGAKVGRHIGASSTPALALTAAALRAMAKEDV